MTCILWGQHCRNNTINTKEVRQCCFDPTIYTSTFMHPFYALHLSLSLMAKTTAQSVCKNNGLFVCLYKSLPSTCFVLLYNFLFMCNGEEDMFLEKAVMILILYHLIILMFIYI